MFCLSASGSTSRKWRDLAPWIHAFVRVFDGSLWEGRSKSFILDQVFTARRLMHNARSPSSVFIQVCVSVPLQYIKKKSRRERSPWSSSDQRPQHVPSRLDSKKTRASNLGWPSTGLLHIRGVHRNSRTNREPIWKLTHTRTNTYIF